MMTPRGLIILNKVELFLIMVLLLFMLLHFTLLMGLCCRVLEFGMRERMLVTSWAFVTPEVLQNHFEEQS
jgi:hypothetical protein